ncbi:MAG: CocE/NonD family hydrolase [Rhizobiaceae bacterium]|nr:CocE/NonD family hydrolase [Rhizobiaceae bacterium]
MSASAVGTANVDYNETLWIPMRDGTRLAARIWIPKSAAQTPVPVILEYIPYRRRDGTRDWDDMTHPWFAEHGYASVRLDMRGSGDSDGVLVDEYLPLEQQDGIDAIEWLAAQPWCNGRVGMIGISWGGFDGLQIAAYRPAALKAVITICFTDDRYADDMHFMGGQFTTDNLEWGSTFFTIMARSPDPLIVGDRWRDMWRQRLEATSPLYVDWMKHQTRDEFWKFASVCEDFSAIECPVMAVGGWADGYTNPVFRLLDGLSSPRLGIVGPWGHKYPHFGAPGPAIGFLQEALRFWDQWLKDKQTGIMDEPRLRAYLQDPVTPDANLAFRPGRWAGADNTVAANTALDLAPGVLGAKAGADDSVTVCSPQSLGIAGGEWCPYGLGGLGPDLAEDQRVDDERSTIFDSQPLSQDMPLLGAPVVELTVSADRPGALLVARLCALAPDGTSERMSFGTLNLTHRDSHENPTPLEPGKTYKIRIKLNDLGYVIPAGYRLRLALSTTYWPTIWPAPSVATVTVDCSASRLMLPVFDLAASGPEPKFQPVETGPLLRYEVHRPGSAKRTVERDEETGRNVCTLWRDDGDATILDVGVRTSFTKMMRYSITDDDPTSARMETEFDVRHSHATWDMRVKTRCDWTCTADTFEIESRLEAFEGETCVFSREWRQQVPRNLI